MKKLKGGVIGFGNVGKNLTWYINSQPDRAEIVAVCNRGESNLFKARDDFGLKVTHDVDELCSWGLDFVLVLSSNHVHKEHVLAACRQGISVFCEKPIALNIEDATEMVLAAEKAEVINIVNYSLRYTDRFQQVKKFIDEGALGEILSLSIERCRPTGLYGNGARHSAIEHPDESGGWAIHHACHQLDLIYYLLGDFKNVYCQGRTTHPDSKRDELLFAMGGMKSGPMFKMSDSLAKLPYEHFVLTGTKASFAYQKTESSSHDRLHEANCESANTMSFEEGWILTKDKKNPSVEHFLDCLEGKEKPIATLRSSLESLKVAIAMNKSQTSGEVIHFT